MSETTKKDVNILSLVNKTIELPTLPEVLMNLNRIIDDPDSSAEDVGKIIAKDPAVSTNILRIVNSAYYALQARVANVSMAVSVMGFDMTKKVALRAAVLSEFGGKGKPKVKHFDPIGFWKHSNFTATAARVMGKESSLLSEVHPEDMFVCGLLHDIGKIIMLEKAPEEYATVLKRAAREGRSDLAVETETFGFSHADVGSVLAIKWFLPEDLSIAIRYHHNPSLDPFHRSLSSLIHLADHLSWRAGMPSTSGLPTPELDHEVYEQTGLDPQRVEDLLPQIQSEFAASGLPW